MQLQDLNMASELTRVDIHSAGFQLVECDIPLRCAIQDRGTRQNLPTACVSPGFGLAQPYPYLMSVGRLMRESGYQLQSVNRHHQLCRVKAKWVHPERVEVADHDSIHGSFALEFNIAQGSVKFQQMAWRQICSNGMMGWGLDTVERVYHTQTVEQDLERMRTVMLQRSGGLEKLQQEIQALQKAPWDYDRFKQLLNLMWPLQTTDGLDDKARKRVDSFNKGQQHKRDCAAKTYIEEQEQTGQDFTAWLGYNALTKTVQHPVKRNGKEVERDLAFSTQVDTESVRALQVTQQLLATSP